MKTEFISWEIAHENDLVREVMEICETDDVLSFFEGDPDMLRIDGETVIFIDLENPENTERAVIYLDGSYLVDEKEIIKRLEKFYSEDENGADNFMKYFKKIESTDINMNNLMNGIAYRGGKGYIYSLFEYIN